MGIDDRIEEFAGLPVVPFEPEQGIVIPKSGILPAYRLGLEYDDFDDFAGIGNAGPPQSVDTAMPIADMLKTFLAAANNPPASPRGLGAFESLLKSFISDPNSAHVRALVIGGWTQEYSEDSSTLIESLVNLRDQLVGLRALFIGDLTYEDCEISWITQSDVSPLLSAYPELEELRIRGGNNLSLGRAQHDKLKKLTLETGGLSQSVVAEIAAAELPSLEHLELWLGSDEYGNDITPDDLLPLLDANLFPKLTYLGLRNDCHSDVTAELLAEHGIPPTVKTLDLSLGNLSDQGGAALARAPWLSQLDRLDLHFHYLSPAMEVQLTKLVSEIDLRDVQEPDEYGDEISRYNAVSE